MSVVAGAVILSIAVAGTQRRPPAAPDYENVRLKNALLAKGYDVNYTWGIGVHSHDMGGAMLPEMMRWLWRDHPVSLDPRDTVERSFRQ